MGKLAVHITATAAIGMLIAAIPLFLDTNAYSIDDMQAMASRTSAFFNEGYVLPNLVDIVMLSSPFHHGHMRLPSASGWFSIRTLMLPGSYCPPPALPTGRDFVRCSIVAIGPVSGF